MHTLRDMLLELYKLTLSQLNWLPAQGKIEFWCFIECADDPGQAGPSAFGLLGGLRSSLEIASCASG